jgi:high affinity sulfate transporter 1
MTVRDFLTARVPILRWLPAYERSSLRSDVIAGVTTASVVIPKAMAYATLAGLAVQVGLYTALLPMTVYAVLGSSLRLSVSTTTTIGILTAAQISQIASDASPDQAATVATSLAVLVGIVLVAAAIVRLGFVAQFISEPVLTGFKAGIGIVIVVDQLPKLFGLHLHKAPLLQALFNLLHAMPERSQPTLVLSIVTIAVMVLLEKFVPRAPAPLLGVALGIGASGVLGLKAMGVDTIGNVPAALPGLALPDSTLFASLWPGALGIALMSFTESIAAGRAFAYSGERRPDPNQELLALGASNALGGLFSAMPTGGGTSQTAVNARAGARTQVSALVTSGATAAVILFLAPLIALMPQATLAAVVIVTSIPLIDLSAFASIRRVRTVEFRWAVAATVGVVVLGTLPGILAAIVLSMVALLRQANFPPVYVLGRKPGTDVFRPRTSEHPEDESVPGLLVLRTEGRIYFANAQRIADKASALVLQANPRTVLLDMGAVPDIEYTGLRMLIEAEATMRARGRTLMLAALNPAALAVIQRSSLGPLLGRERMFFTVAQAVAAYVARAATTP